MKAPGVSGVRYLSFNISCMPFCCFLHGYFSNAVSIVAHREFGVWPLTARSILASRHNGRFDFAELARAFR